MFPAGNGGTIELVYTQVKWSRSLSWHLLVMVSLRIVVKGVSSALGICSDYPCSCMWFLDSKIHDNFGKRQPCGKHVFLLVHMTYSFYPPAMKYLFTIWLLFFFALHIFRFARDLSLVLGLVLVQLLLLSLWELRCSQVAIWFDHVRVVGPSYI